MQMKPPQCRDGKLLQNFPLSSETGIIMMESVSASSFLDRVSSFQF